MPDVLDEYEVEPDPSDPDIVDLALDEVMDTPVQPQQQENPPVETMSKQELLHAVLSRGSVMFNDGRMLTKCPCRSNPAACGMFSLPHPATNDPIMVCTGPVVQKSTKSGLMGPTETYYTTGQARYDCPYNPDRINERPPQDTVDVHSDWL